MILSDKHIKQLCSEEHNYTATNEIVDIVASNKQPMIYPFVDEQVRRADNGAKIVSYGLTSFGYDVRLANKFKIFTNVNNHLLDPMLADATKYVDHEGDYVIIPPNSYVLGHTVEIFDMPRNVNAIVLGKSTYARLGISINCTPVEAGFRGSVVIEIANMTPIPAKVYAGMGIAQFQFFLGSSHPLVSYADRNGKYQDQRGIQTALL